MGNLNIQYGTNGQAITCSLAPGGTGLANGSSRQSTVIDNTSNLFIDAFVSITIKSGASGTSSTGTVSVYFYGTVDGGSNYTDACTGSDASFTPTSPTNLRGPYVMNVVANAVSYNGGPWSVASFFGGTLPAKWGIVITNNSGAALDTTEANHIKKYQGVSGQY